MSFTIVNKKADLIRSILFIMGCSAQRVGIIEYLLRLGSYYPQPLRIKAETIAKAAGCNEKTVDRCIAWLREEGLIKTKRLKREDGYLSINEIDVKELLKVLAKLLGKQGKSIPVRVGNVLGIAGGSWHTFKRLLTGRTSTVWRLKYGYQSSYDGGFWG